MVASLMALRISHLRAAEIESIPIFREIAAEFQRPERLSSIGKDSAVAPGLAQEVPHPGPIPFPIVYRDTEFKLIKMSKFG